MENMIEWLKSIGWTEERIAYVLTHSGDADLWEYLLYLRAVFDDRHEYLD